MGNISRKLKRAKKRTALSKGKLINELLKKAEIFEQQQEWHLAQTSYQKIISIDPTNHYSLWRLGRILMNPLIRDYTNAEKILKKTVALHPENIDYQLDLTSALLSTSTFDQAVEMSRKILRSNPENHLALHNLGFALMRQKDFDNAAGYFKQAIQIAPAFDPAYVELFHVLYRLGDKAALRQQLTACENNFLTVEGVKNRTDIKYVLGKYYDRLDEYETAFRFLSEANAERSASGPYNINQFENIVNTIINTCNTAYISKNEQHGFHDSTPIFIVGMPRSGTSLVEQILASHPDVHAGGELKYFDSLSSMFNYSSPKHFNHLGRKYVEEIKKHSNTMLHVTDKMPHNYIYAGLIKAALPEAKIIHCMRDPMDTCFSCFREGFAEQLMSYTCDLNILGQYYNHYRRLMDHWRTVMPGHMLEIQYEDVVHNLEQETRRMLEYCDLEWSDSCLHYYDSKAFMTTASRNQVTQPVYTTSIGRWKNYQDELKPLTRLVLEQK